MKHLFAAILFFLFAHSSFIAGLSGFSGRQYIITQILVKGKPVYRVAGCAVLRKGDRNEYGNVSMGRDILRWRLSPGDKIEVLNPDTEIIVRRGGRYHSLKMERAGKIMRWYVPALRKPIRQTQGRIYYKFRKHPRRRKRIIAGWGRRRVTVSTDGTEFLFKTGQGKFTLKLTEGRVRVALPSGKRISVKAGEQLQGSFKDSSYTKSSLQRNEWKTLLSEGKKITRSTEAVYKDDLSFVENNRVIRYKYKKENRLQEEKATHVFKSRKEADLFASRLRARKIKLTTGRDYWKAAVVFSRGGKEGKKVAYRFFKKAIQLGVAARLTKYLYEEFGYFLVHGVNSLAEGEALLKKGLQKYSSYAAFWVLLQELYAKQKDWGKLQRAVAKLKALSGGKYLWYKNRAKWHQRYGKTVMAEINYRKALAIIVAKGGPRTAGHFWTVVYLAKVLHSLGGNDEAEFVMYRYLHKLKKQEKFKLSVIREEMNSFLGDLYIKLGKSSRALLFYKKALAISKHLYAKNAAKAVYIKNLSVSYNRLADLLIVLGRRGEAFRFYIKSCTLRERLYKKQPQDVWLLGAISSAYDRLALMYMNLDKNSRALGYCEKALFYSKLASKAAKKNIKKLYLLSVGYERMGDVHLKLGNKEEAFGYYKNMFNVREKIYKLKPHDVSLAHALAVSYNKLGELYVKLIDVQKAKVYYEKALLINKALYVKDARSFLHKNGIAFGYERLGNIYLKLGKVRKALSLYKKSLSIAKVISQEDPYNIVYARDLASSYVKIGHLFYKMRNYSMALPYYLKDLAIATRLYKNYYSFPVAVEYVKSNYIVGRCYIKLKQHGKAVYYLKCSLRVLNLLHAKSMLPKRSKYYNWISFLENLIIKQEERKNQ